MFTPSLTRFRGLSPSTTRSRRRRPRLESLETRKVLTSWFNDFVADAELADYSIINPTGTPSLAIDEAPPGSLVIDTPQRGPGVGYDLIASVQDAPRVLRPIAHADLPYTVQTSIVATESDFTFLSGLYLYSDDANLSNDWVYGANTDNVKLDYGLGYYSAAPWLPIGSTDGGVELQVEFDGSSNYMLRYRHIGESAWSNYQTFTNATNFTHIGLFTKTWPNPGAGGIAPSVVATFDYLDFASEGEREFIVDTTEDILDGDTSSIDNLVTDPGADGFISLREAILAANNTPNMEDLGEEIPDEIRFDFNVIAPRSTIQLDPAEGPLPTITDPVVINAIHPEIGCSFDFGGEGFIGGPVIELDGSLLGSDAIGLRVTAGNSEIAGLVINGFSARAMELATAGGNLVHCNLIGTNAKGDAAVPNGSPAYSGAVYVDATSPDNEFYWNLISGNQNVGLFLVSDNNVVYQNLVGTDVNGSAALGNGADGIYIVGDANYLDNNLISGNGDNGVTVAGQFNTLEGNYVGLDMAGTSSVGNTDRGVLVIGDNNTIGGLNVGNVISGNNGMGVGIGGSSNEIVGNLIGLNVDGDTAVPNEKGVVVFTGADNLITDNAISGNAETGVEIGAAAVSGTMVYRNVIGLNPSGDVAIGNGGSGVVLHGGTTNNHIGNSDGRGNLISGNGDVGVFIYGGSSSNYVQGNVIGLAVDLETALGNGNDGVYITDSPANVVGGSEEGTGNIISGNDAIGVSIYNTDSIGNVVQGNRIGTNFSGSVAVPNQGGVAIAEGASGNLVGGSMVAAGNLLSGNAGNGVTIASGAFDNTVQFNLIGTDITGNSALPNEADGVELDQAGSGNTIGDPGLLNGSTAIQQLNGNEFAGNVVSANAFAGVRMRDSDGNTVAGNMIGLGLNGDTALGNQDDGVNLDFSSNNVVDTNVISTNGLRGVIIVAGSGNQVSHNLIGTDITGMLPRGNQGFGAAIYSGASDNIIGGDTEAEGNVISANLDDGVTITHSGSSDNTVMSNIIGLAIDGETTLGNNGNGVWLDGVSENLVSTNLISANENSGVLIQRGSDNRVQGNYIGTNADGTAPLGNTEDGVRLSSTSENLIGGTTPGAGNVISGNELHGVNLQSASNNTVQGNLIGTDATGVSAIGNYHGVNLIFASDNLIGGTAEGAGNVISGNQHGIFITSTSAVRNTIQGNLIGTDITGMAAVPNENIGVSVSSSNDNVVGGTSPGAGNVISGNEYAGVRIAFGASGTVVQGNLIGTTATGDALLGNYSNGLVIEQGANHTLVGGTEPGAGNVIAGNARGIRLGGPDVSDNVVQGNFVGTNPAGDDLGNDQAGIFLESGAFNNLIGGLEMAAGNVVAFNGAPGVHLRSDVEYTDLNAGPGNAIVGNSIYANGGLGIDLGGDPPNGDGVTPNDLGDPDGGPNNLQNYPVIDSISGGATLTVEGTLNSLSDRDFRIEFFANGDIDPSGYGEGEQWLGFVNVTTDTSGDADFTFNVDALTVGDRAVTATATLLGIVDNGEFVNVEGENGFYPIETSEFSAAVIPEVTNVPPVIEVTATNAGECGNVRMGQTVTVEAYFDDPDEGDTHTAWIDWGDGSDPAMAFVDQETDTVHAEHVYGMGGFYDVTVTVIDAAETSDADTFGVVITGAGYRDGVLQVVGTDDLDYLNISRERSSRLVVRYNFDNNRFIGEYRVNRGLVDEIQIVMCGGEDHVYLGSGFAVPSIIDTGEGVSHVDAGEGDDLIFGGKSTDYVLSEGGNDIVYSYGGVDHVNTGTGNDMIFAGDGADHLNSGPGDDVVVAGPGADHVNGEDGRDILIGGSDSDYLEGGPGQDILIPGTTDHDDDFDALIALRAEWVADKTFDVRRDNLYDGSGDGTPLNVPYFISHSTVAADGANNHTSGGPDRDWIVEFNGIVPTLTTFNNKFNANDVNDDGEVTLGDALFVVSELRDHGVTDLTDYVFEEIGCFVDVNGDGVVTLNDALMIISRLRDGQSVFAFSEPEVEALINLAAPETPLEISPLAQPEDDYRDQLMATLAEQADEDPIDPLVTDEALTDELLESLAADLASVR